MAGVATRRPSARTLVPRICNGLIWLVFCALAGTGLLISFRLPPGSRGGRGLSALGWGRHDWGDLHAWLSYGFLVLVVAHLALHWRWFWQIAARKRLWPILLGIGAGIALILATVMLPVEKDGRGEGPGRPGNHQRGR
ncbi:DUF4405 domain-containing protein [Haloferula sargassicola]|uniref:Flavinylation-associated cytochrome domain-containing protein n=1 Tax=Haloferula sargassicola TaxID=490096 RepID=A0ABP9UQ26_9BACT